MIADIETASVYGRQAGAALAAIKSIDLEDPAAAVMIVQDQLSSIASAMGFEMGDAGQLAGAMGKVIDVFTDRLRIWTESRKAASDAARDREQERIMTALFGDGHVTGRYQGRNAWIVELSANDLPGDGGYYSKAGATGLSAVSTKKLDAALPLADASGRGCLRQGGEAGRPAAGVWRFWPTLYPIYLNTQALTLQTPAPSPSGDALVKLITAGNMAFDPTANLLIDGRDVAGTLSSLKEWSRPLFRSDLGTATEKQPYGSPITLEGPNMRMPENGPATGARYTYERKDGTLLVYGEPPPGGVVTRWLQTKSGVISLEPEAYNHVLRTCARFFAYRENLLRRSASWENSQREAAARSSEPSVLAALKRKPTRVGRAPTGRPGKPTTTGVNGPAAQHKHPTRVGRLDAWPSIAAIEESIARTEST